MPFFKQKAAEPSAVPSTEPSTEPSMEPDSGFDGPFDAPFGEVPDEPLEQMPSRPMRLYKQIRRDARRCLSGRWAKAAAGVLFLMGVAAVFWLGRNLLADFLGLSVKAVQWKRAVRTLALDPLQMSFDILVFLLAEFVLCPLMLGYLKFIFQMTSGEEPVLAVIFEPMQSVKSFLRSFLMILALQFLGLVMTALCCLPGAMALWTAGRMGGSSGTDALLRLALVLLGAMLVLLGVLAAMAFMTRYIPAPFILAMDEQVGVFSALSLSAKATKGERSELFAMLLSFIPLALLGVLLVPLIFLLPYEAAACGLFSRVLLDRLAREE